MKPRVRSGLLVRRVGDEVVVYDPVSHTAHCLNHTAALVFAAADGTRTVAAIATGLHRDTGVETSAALARLALERLAEAGLLDEGLPSQEPSLSRRRTMGQLAVGVAALVPLVLSLAVPTPAEAAATCIPASSCDGANFGNPCYVLSQAECASKTGTGTPGDCQ